MGFLDKTFQKLKIEAEKVMEEHNKKKTNGEKYDSQSSTISSSSMSMAEVMHYSSNATRWEKAVIATDSIVAEVSNFDPDGVEIVCVGGDGCEANEIEWHEGITNTQGLESTITEKSPGGSCSLGNAMDQVLTRALEKDLETTPCSVLVLTAGKPDDSDVLEDSLRRTSQFVADNGGIERLPLSVTFIQIGNDREASEYLEYLDKKMVGISEGKKVDIVDTMGYGELKQTIETIKNHTTNSLKKKKQQEAQTAILGAVAGAAMGVGGMLVAGKRKTKTLPKSWSGEWKCFYDDELVATLTVADDQKGNLTIDGVQEQTIPGVYQEDPLQDFFIRFTEPDGEVIEGTFDSGILHWSDGTRWEAKTKVAKVLGLATAGAVLVGATGYAIHKKFFQKVKGMEACDYVLVLDRSAKMALADGRD